MKVWAAEENSEGVVTPDLEEVFGDEATDIAMYYERFLQDLEDRGECCIDANRIALIGDKETEETMDFYKSFITCCGYEDIEVEVNGKLYMFGANFGH